MALQYLPTLSVARTFRYTLAPLSACTLEYFDGPKRQTINSDNMYIRDLGSFRASASSSCFLPRGNIFHIFSFLSPCYLSLVTIKKYLHTESSTTYTEDKTTTSLP